MTVIEKTKLTYAIGGALTVNRLGYGAMQLSGFGVFGEVEDRENAKKILQAAIAGGINFIDTAEAYGPKFNESLIADALHPYAKGLVIATKGGFSRTGPNKWIPNGDPAFIKSNIEGSLKRLNVDIIDLWQLHRIDPKIPVEETLAPVADAVKAGKIRFVGLSEVNVAQIEQAEKVVPIVSVQNQYNLSMRQWEDVVDYTAKTGKAFIPWFPLASGPDKMADKIETIAKAHDATVAQVALAWLLRRSSNILLIPGTKSVNHLQENLKALQLELTDEDFDTLSK
ncbi:MAG: aldo/keto reductase [Chitinophagaceae bacterium]